MLDVTRMHYKLGNTTLVLFVEEIMIQNCCSCSLRGDSTHTHSLWHNLEDPAAVSTKTRKQWGRDERALLRQSSNAMKFLSPNRKPDVSVISILPRPVTNALIAWRVGALTASSQICPSRHHLTRCHVSECVQASQRIQDLDLCIPLELPDQDNSVIDFIFQLSPKKKWTISDAEVLVLIQIL